MRGIKLQIFYIIIKLFNFCFSLLIFKFLRDFFCLIAGYKIGKGTSIQSVRFFSFGKLKIGNNTIINSGVYLDNRRGIEIGNNVVIAHDSKIYTLGHDVNDSSFKTVGEKVVIQDFVIIFSNVLIMPGVTIGRGAVILPGSVIAKDVGDMEIVGGNPSKVKKIRKNLHINKKVVDFWFSI
jgi:maltose O-acetyltransferase